MQCQRSIYVLCYGIISCVLLSGCVGPLQEAVREELTTSFVGQRYLAHKYLGSRYNLVYTNNSIDGRNPTGIFINQSLSPWYETDASFFESGSSGRYTIREELQAIDRDLGLRSWAEGISPGQLVAITRLIDKSDQIIIEIETLEQYPVDKTYGFRARRRTQPRASRLHLVFGKEGMQNFNSEELPRILDVLLAPVPSLITMTGKEDFILSRFPDTSLSDLVELTGLSTTQVLTIYYTGVLVRSDFPPAFQERLSNVLTRQYDRWFKDDDIWVQDVRAGQRTLVLDCAIHEMAQSTVYHSPELRAAYVFKNILTRMTESFLPAFRMSGTEEQEIEMVVNFTYPYIDNFGQRFDEAMSFRLTISDIQQAANSTIGQQEFADRVHITMGGTPLRISLDALNAVERVKPTVPSSWKYVHVELEDWWQADDEEPDLIVIKGRVENTGTWIAEDVTVTIEAYNKFGLTIKTESTTLHGYLKPGKSENFTIKFNVEKIDRIGRPRVTWTDVE